MSIVFPDHTFKGTVVAVSPGTGAQFSILPPQNASGNWVKVVQRVPVRIAFDKGEDVQAAARRHERHRGYRHRPQPHSLHVGQAQQRAMSPAAATMDPKLRRLLVTVLRHDGDHHAGARHHHRQCGAALYAGFAVGLARPDQLGAHLLYRRRRHHDGAGRLDGRPLRPQATVHHLRRRLHRRVVAMRAGAEHRADGAVPPAARHVRARPWCRCRNR